MSEQFCLLCSERFHKNIFKKKKKKSIIVKQAEWVILAHLQSGQELETGRVWRVRVKDSGWGNQTGCHSMTGGILKRSCGCSASGEAAFAWTASSRCYADGCTRSQKGQHVHVHFRRTSNNPLILRYFALYYYTCPVHPSSYSSCFSEPSWLCSSLSWQDQP